MGSNGYWTLVDSEGKEHQIPANGETALQGIRTHTHLTLQAPCSGKGRCGKCVIFSEESHDPELNDTGTEKPVLSCLLKPREGERFRMPVKGDFQVSLNGLRIPQTLQPMVQITSITIPKQNRESNPDLQCLLQEALGIDEPLPHSALQSFFPVNPLGYGSCKAVLYRGKPLIFLALDQPVVVCAVDIGTTTLALICVDAQSGEVLGQASGLNNQSTWGADVLSRIQSVREGTATTRELQDVLVNQIETLIEKACPKGSTPVVLTVAGNTAMIHSIFGLYSGLLGESPFLTTARLPGDHQGRSLGFSRFPDLLVQGLPCLSAYVGADIAAGIVCADMDKKTDTILLLDVGTNGEMALSSGGNLVSCSTAAGPAFEGAHIHQGIGGVPGAIESVNVYDNTFVCTTIGNQNIAGICGSGIIDLMACLLNTGIVDEVGSICPELVESYANCRWIETDQGGELEFRFQDLGTLRFTGKDIREIQLAKAAIAAGIQILLESMALKPENIDEFWIAGGFGGYINPISAARIGLYPEGLLSKVISAGNTSLQGAYQSLMNRENFERMHRVEKRMQTIDLASEPGFQDAYVESMIFPEG